MRQTRVLDYSTAIERVVRKKRRFLLLRQLKLRWNESFDINFVLRIVKKIRRRETKFFSFVLLEIIKKSYFNRRVVLYVEDERYRWVCQYFTFFCFFHFYLLVLIRHKKLGIKNFINKEHIERVCVWKVHFALKCAFIEIKQKYN